MAPLLLHFLDLVEYLPWLDERVNQMILDLVVDAKTVRIVQELSSGIKCEIIVETD